MCDRFYERRALLPLSPCRWAAPKMPIFKRVNHLSNKVCIPSKTEDLNLSIFNIVTWINESPYSGCWATLGGRRSWGHGKQKSPLSVLHISPLNSTNVGISLQIYLIFNVNPFSTHWCKISRPYLLAVPEYLIWTNATPQIKWFFWPNPFEIDVMITSLIELLELTNFGHMTTSTT